MQAKKISVPLKIIILSMFIVTVFSIAGLFFALSGSENIHGGYTSMDEYGEKSGDYNLLIGRLLEGGENLDNDELDDFDDEIERKSKYEEENGESCFGVGSGEAIWIEGESYEGGAGDSGEIEEDYEDENYWDDGYYNWMWDYYISGVSRTNRYYKNYWQKYYDRKFKGMLTGIYYIMSLEGLESKEINLSKSANANNKSDFYDNQPITTEDTATFVFVDPSGTEKNGSPYVLKTFRKDSWQEVYSSVIHPSTDDISVSQNEGIITITNCYGTPVYCEEHTFSI